VAHEFAYNSHSYFSHQQAVEMSDSSLGIPSDLATYPVNYWLWKAWIACVDLC